MANCTDAFGTVTVRKVGIEFLEFIKNVQGKDAYYLLVDNEDFAGLEPKEDIEFGFSTFGRWCYDNNAEGYLSGVWMQSEEEQAQYVKFIDALKAKDGQVEIKYTDSDVAMDWMGAGTATLKVVDGVSIFNDTFKSDELTVIGYAKLNGEDEYWALESLHGDEVVAEYDEYVEKWKQENTFVKGDTEPAGPSEWYDNDYEG